MNLKYQVETIRAIRQFFDEQGFADVLTPPMVENPGMETHIHPFEVYSKRTNSPSGLYLHTSPEFHMKKLLAEDSFDKIFTVSYSFRDEPSSEIHRNQFVMLEWYRKNQNYFSIMDDVESLIQYVDNQLVDRNIKVTQSFSKSDFSRITVQNLFLDFLNIDILEYLDTNDLKHKIESDFKDVPLPSVDCSWEDYFFLLFLNKVEPYLKNFKAIIIYEWPYHLAALSTLKSNDPRVCERFELYLNGIELCNCFNELTDFKLQKKRFAEQSSEKKKLYGYKLPEPNKFYDVLKNGYPKSAGVALGVERLVKALNPTSQSFFE